MSDRRVDWMDEIFSNYAKSGGVNELPGKGKPLDAASGDALHEISWSRCFIRWRSLEASLMTRRSRN